MAGALVLVATPLGNLGDVSERALQTLRSASVIACEDSRHTRKLLNHFNIRDVPTLSVHQHNERERADEIVRRVSAGETVALVSDAGMPAISDPGEVVVAAVAGAGLVVSVVPGPSAVPAALAVSGLPTDRFCFEGFLPRKGSERRQRLADIANEVRTIVVYESPHRVHGTAVDLGELCGPDRRIVLVRELTKIYEEIWRGTIEGLIERSGDDLKGECVLVLAGANPPSQEVDDSTILEALEAERATGTSKKEAVASVALRLDVARNRVYDLSVKR